MHFFHSNDSSNMPFTPSPINLKVAVPMKGHAQGGGNRLIINHL